jgi:hypothetical protein
MAWMTWKIAGRAFAATSLAALLLVVVNKWESAVEWKTRAEHYVETMLGMARTVEEQRAQTQVLIEAVNALAERRRQAEAAFDRLVEETRNDPPSDCDSVRLYPDYVQRLHDGSKAASGDNSGMPGDSGGVAEPNTGAE